MLWMAAEPFLVLLICLLQLLSSALELLCTLCGGGILSLRRDAVYKLWLFRQRGWLPLDIGRDGIDVVRSRRWELQGFKDSKRSTKWRQDDGRVVSAPAQQRSA
jgi:hypothetical protein